MPRLRRNDGDDDGLDEEQRVNPSILELAKEIQREVERVAADPDAHPQLIAELIDRAPADERMKLARTIFDRLAPADQWAVIERVFGDDEIRTYLEEERAALLEHARLNAERQALARTARQQKRLDVGNVTEGEHVTLGLFRANDVGAAITRGHRSSTCARKLVLRAVGDGRLQVIEDVFNPAGGYFVTAEYSEDTWREEDRLLGHAVVRVGSLSEGEGDDDPDTGFEPVVYPGGRVDFETGGRAIRGRLHLGFAMLGELDVFVP